MNSLQAMRAGIVLLLASFAAGCGESPDEPANGDSGGADVSFSTADLGGIVERGTIRVLVEREPDSFLPRHGAALYAERELATQFARRHGITAEFVYVDRFAELLPALLDGRGDLAAANLTVTEERRQRVRFTQPLGYSRDTLVLAKGDAVPSTEAPLSGRLAARAETTLLETARRLAGENEGLEAIGVDDALTNDALVDRLVDGQFDYVVQDGNVVERMLAYRDDVVAGPPVTDPRPLAWAVRRSNGDLVAALDEFLAEYRLLGEKEARYVDDLPELRQRRRLRMITRNNAATYFLWRGELLGFEYELAKRFADSLGLRLEVVVAPSHDDMIPMLLAGEGDFIASYLVPTEARRAEGVAFSRPYHYASEVLVGRAGEEAVDSLSELGDRHIAVRPSSAYHTHLAELRSSQGAAFELLAAPSDMETQEIIAAVAAGRFDLTVADSHLLAIEMTWRDDITGLMNLGEEQPHSWAVHPDNTELLDAVNAYIEDAYRGLFYNISYAKYFENPRHIGEQPAGLIAPGQVSPYDEFVRHYADQYGFDWRLILAQMHKESRFDPEARSWMGAQGLMQVLPRTAAEFGFEDLQDPETGIHAGIRYLDWVRDRFPKRLEPGERTWFALAGYNAGHGHVRDARRLAGTLGYDPDRWFGNVENAMLKLSEPEYAKRARYGYVRGKEPVGYVRAIRRNFRAYTRLLGR